MTFPWASHYDPGVPLTVGPVTTSLPRLLLLASGLVACSGARPVPRAPLFPPLATWKTLLDEVIVEPLVAGGPRLFVATRDGAVRSLDQLTGAVQWKVEGFPGRLSAREGVLVVRDEAASNGSQSSTQDSLPSGPFSPLEHRTLEGGLRSWVAEQADIDLGYVEQLYSFGDRGRHAQPGDAMPHVVSIGYLALTNASQIDEAQRGSWRSWYHYFPWEDWRKGRPQILETEIVPRLREWAGRPQQVAEPARPIARQDRIRMCFGLDGAAWDEEKVLDRYELLYEAGLAEEARRDGREAALAWSPTPRLGAMMRCCWSTRPMPRACSAGVAAAWPSTWAWRIGSMCASVR